MSIGFASQNQSDSTQPRWVRFVGTMNRLPDYCELRPDEDDRIRIHLENEDVREEPTGIVVRVGAHPRAIMIPPDSVVRQKLPRKTSNQAKCASGMTCCLGGAEMCCDDGTIVGSCVGYWACP